MRRAPTSLTLAPAALRRLHNGQVPTRYFDVIALGRSLGTLAAGALLARRGFRVLLYGQGEPAPEYHFEGYRLRRSAFAFTAASSPVWRLILRELAQTPRFRQHVVQLDPIFSVLTPKRRLEVPPDGVRFMAEVDREFPESRQLVDELLRRITSANQQGDLLFEQDLPWPPANWYERWRCRRAASGVSLLGSGAHQDLLQRFPVGHPLRRLIESPALFASDRDCPASQLPPFALARLIGAWFRGVQALEGDLTGLESFLCERIAAHGGDCQLTRRVDELWIDDGRIAGVRDAMEDAPVGCSALVANLSGEMLADLSRGEGISRSARHGWPHLTPTAGHFVVNLLLRRGALGAPLGREAFLFPEEEPSSSPRRPVLHLQRVAAVHEGTVRRDLELLVVEFILPTRGVVTLLEARDLVLQLLEEHFPFLREHLVLVDSPHDGLPLQVFEHGQAREIDRVHVVETQPQPEQMRWRWSEADFGFEQLGAEPVAGPIPGSYLVGPTVVPALGQEGELLAAWRAARTITKMDRSRQRQRSQMWSKVETT